VAAFASFSAWSGRTLTVSRGPVPIVVTRGGLLPVSFLAAAFAAYSVGARPLLVAGATLLGGLGGGLSLVVHELGHVRAARRLPGVRPARISLIWLGAVTQFEGAYRSGREQVRVAVGGPAASFAFAVVLTCGVALPIPRALQYGCFGLALLNIAIAFLTLIPVQPLDGYKLIVGLVWCVCGGEQRARSIVRRLGLACVALDVTAASYVLVEKPFLGCFVVLLGAVAYAQRRVGLLHARRVAAPK
jgi:Zn-dependent protease